MIRLRPTPVVCALVACLAGCEWADHPDLPLPASTEWHLLDGGTLRARDLHGRPWVIALWVPGCHVCQREAPHLEALRREYAPAGVGFLALSLEPDEALVREGARKMGLGLPLAVTREETLGPLGVGAVPSVAWVDASGMVRTAATGERSLGFLRRHTEALLAPRPAP
ncbi:MAG: TlpA family protein disulfide reductase [Deltaproteobacteria bacterium]|nr:TlpA family protein disulfide reductase [Deltaproteobacteria bacterium]